MSSPINKETLDHLAKLARVEINAAEEEKLLHDLQKILDYVAELQGVDTTSVEAVTGGTELKNVFREDTERENTNQGAGTEALPEIQDGYLKIPPVFE